jgi:CTP:molybdopterin cytidylyltransferase MocA
VSTGRPVVAAITAAGASRRMGRPKALLDWKGGPALSSIVATLRASGVGEPAVVCGPSELAVADEVRRAGAVALINPEPERGRFSSIQVAAGWALQAGAPAARGTAALVLWPVDCPGVSAATVTALCAAAAAHPGANVAPRFGDRVGHPVILCPETLRAIVAAPLESSLRELIHLAPGGRRLVEVADPRVCDNLNGPADLAAVGERP